MRLRLASKLGYVSLPSLCVQVEVMGNSIICQLLLSKKKDTSHLDKKQQQHEIFWHISCMALLAC